jgi:putative ABC transport system permease protein
MTFRLAFRALEVNKLRAALTVLGIIIGVGAVIALVSVGQGAQKQITDNLQGLGTNLLFVRPGSSQTGVVRQNLQTVGSLTSSDAAAMAAPGAVAGIVAVAPVRTIIGQLVVDQQNWSTRIVGVTPAYAQVRNFQIGSGDFLDQKQIEAESRVVVLGPTAAANLFGDADPIGQTIRVSAGGRIGENFKVIGVTKSKGSRSFINDDDLALIPLTTLNRRLSSVPGSQGEPNVSEIDVEMTSQDQSDQVIADIGTFLRQRHRVKEDDFNITSEADIVRIFVQITDIFTLVLAAIAGISLLVGGIGIMNIMLVSVTERTREIGIRRAIGARRNDILAQFLVEALAVSLVGGALGIGLGVGISLLVARVPLNGQFLEPVISAGSVLLAFGVSATIGLFFGFYPAMRASRLHPIEALRYE